MVIRIEGQIYKVLEMEFEAEAAQMSGVVKTKLINARSGRMWEPHFRPQEKLEDLQLDRRVMEFLYADGDNCTFMDPETCDQFGISDAILGSPKPFLQPGMELPVEFFEDEPISVVFPDIADALVANTAPPSHAQQDSAWKEVLLENGMKIHVPLFVGPGEHVRFEVKSGRYVERARVDRKRSA